MLAGLVTPDEGRVVYRGRVFFDSSRGVNLPPQKRKLGYVFQDYSLFPHLTLHGNAAFAARDRGEVDALMDFFGLTELRDRKPHQVSGGERQRCAVCQALARDPQLLLLDEPFSALDVVTRRILRNELKKITEKRTFPVVYVTHDVRKPSSWQPVCDRRGLGDGEWMNGITAPGAGTDAGNKAARTTKAGLALLRGQSHEDRNYSYDEYLHLVKSFTRQTAPGLGHRRLMVDLALRSLPEGESSTRSARPRCLPIVRSHPCTIGNGCSRSCPSDVTRPFYVSTAARGFACTRPG
jgi:molybdate transport system ATP-binding protein